MYTLKMNHFFKMALFVGLLFFTACSSDDENGPAGEFATGTFVVNEGNFQSANGSVTHYNANKDVATNAIFSTTNEGAVLGDVAQSMAIDNGLAYIVVNNSNKIEVVNSNTFESEYTVEGLQLPRYMTFADGKCYITEWVSFADNGRVSILDLESRTIERTIEVGAGAEDILALNGKLYVSNSFGTTISVIDLSTNTVTKTVELEVFATEMMVDKNGKLWAISGGTTDYSVTPAVPNNDGKLIRINPATDAIELTINLNTNVLGKFAMNGEKDAFYVVKANSVYEISITGTEFTPNALITEINAIGFSSIGLNTITNEIFVGDSRGFQGNGTVYIYNVDGSKKSSFTAGIGPSSFVFK